MRRVKNLFPTQLKVLDDLFTAELDEEAVLKKWRVKPRTYARWHTMENFAAEYKRRLKQVRLKSELIITRFAPVAAGKLVELTQSKRQETARKACVDIINQVNPRVKKKEPDKEKQKEGNEELPPEVASRLLDALANEGKQKP